MSRVIEWPYYQWADPNMQESGKEVAGRVDRVPLSDDLPCVEKV